MAISSVTSKVIYVGDAATATLAYPFKIIANSDLTVSRYVTATSAASVLVLDTDYVVTGAGVDTGGNVLLTGSYAGGMPTGSNTVIQRVMPLTQAVDYVENDPFPAATHELALDKLTMIEQQQQEEIDRCIKADINQTSSNVNYTDFVAQAVAASSSATVAVAQASAAAASASAASSSETNADSYATAAASSATVAVASEAVITSSCAVCVSSAAGSVVEATAAASSATVAVAQGAIAVSSATVAVAQSAIAVSSATVSVDEAAVAVSSATVAVAAAATNYRYFRTTIINPYNAYGISPSIPLLHSLNAAITINDIEISCDKDPNAQISGNLFYADAFIGTANPVAIDKINTTSGVLVDGSISNASVAAGKCIYLAFDAQPSAGILTVNFNIKYTYD